MDTDPNATRRPPPRGVPGHMKPVRRGAVALFACAAVALAVAVLVARQALATVGDGVTERGMLLASQLSGFEELQGRTTGVTLNGQRFALSTLVVAQSVDEVTARVVALCGKDNGQFAGELADRMNTRDTGGVSVVEQLLVLREKLEDGGAIAICLAGVADGGMAAFARRVRRFAQTRDVSDLGNLRLARMRPLASGTHVLLAGADSQLRLDELVPGVGQDAIGSEAVPGVRPPQSIRFIAAQTEGTPHHFTAYRSTLSAAEVFGGYRRKLLAAGYTPLSAGGLSTELPRQLAERGTFTGVYRRGDHAVIATSVGRDEGSLMSVLQLADGIDTVQPRRP